jgi:hypothetical protein
MLTLCLINYTPCHEDTWDCGTITPPLLISVLDGREWPISRPGCFIPGESTHWIRSWFGASVNLQAVQGKLSAPAENRTPDIQSIAHQYTDCALPAHRREGGKTYLLTNGAEPPPAFYGTRRFKTVFTRALHWSLS